VSYTDIRKQCNFERQVQMGDKCVAFWTVSGFACKGHVEVVKENEKSWRVRLMEAVPGPTGPDDYPVNRLLNIPNFLNRARWNWANRLATCDLGHCIVKGDHYGGMSREDRAKCKCPICGNKLVY